MKAAPFARTAYNTMAFARRLSTTTAASSCSRADLDAGPGDRCCRRTPTTPDAPRYTPTPAGAGRGRRVPQPRGRGRGRRHRLELVASVRRSGQRRRPRPVHGQRHVGEAIGHLPGAGLQSTGSPIPRGQARSGCCRKAGRGAGSLSAGVRRVGRPPREVPATRDKHTTAQTFTVAAAGGTGCGTRDNT